MHTCTQEQQRAIHLQEGTQAWAEIVQQLRQEPVQSLDEGQAAVVSALGTLQGLEEQQQHAFQDLAAKDEALSIAESRIGESPPACSTAGPHCKQNMSWSTCRSQ